MSNAVFDNLIQLIALWYCSWTSSGQRSLRVTSSDAETSEEKLSPYCAISSACCRDSELRRYMRYDRSLHCFERNSLGVIFTDEAKVSQSIVASSTSPSRTSLKMRDGSTALLSFEQNARTMRLHRRDDVPNIISGGIGRIKKIRRIIQTLHVDPSFSHLHTFYFWYLL